MKGDKGFAGFLRASIPAFILKGVFYKAIVPWEFQS